MPLQPDQILILIEAVGTIAFAVSGAMAAIRSRFDLFGIFVLAFVTAIGGGTIRDLLIGNTPVNWLTDTLTISSVIIGFLFTLIIYRQMQKLEGWLFTFDAAGLGLFTVVGTQIALEAGMSVGVSIALGTVTGCFGGVLRDVLAGDKPLIFQKEVYAMAAVTGGIVFTLILQIWDALLIAQIAGIITIVLIRVVAVRKGLGLPSLES
ncbi:MAG: trimeric intracellular cation channel family protein [Balneolaceae bacterium]|nr:trimeric intracellular cation channel family protein [Balneolaceae bacterium]MCH8550078.1 trimeric intracellular cation channel family protein [Balneolaceae bacterium]